MEPVVTKSKNTLEKLNIITRWIIIVFSVWAFINGTYEIVHLFEQNKLDTINNTRRSETNQSDIKQLNKQMTNVKTLIIVLINAKSKY